LLKRLRGAGYVIASGTGSAAIGGDVSVGGIHADSSNIITDGIRITGDGNVIGNQNTVSVMKTKSVAQGSTPDDFVALIAQIRELLRTAHLHEDDHDTVAANLKTVEREARKAKPRFSLIESSLKSVESLLKSTESLSLDIANLLFMIPQAVEFARRLFP
jgi:hypothetical protein